jgi:hypothetical protein
VTSDGTEIRFDSFEGFPSDDGRLVAFESRGPMHPDATQPPGWVSPNAFLRDRLLGQTTFVSPDAAGQVPFFPVTLRDADLSRSEVLLQTRQQLLDPLGNPLPSQSNLYLRNWDTGTIELVSVAVDGGLGDNASTLGRIVTGGRYVIFQSAATNLPAAPETGFNLYVRDRQSATTTRISRPWHGGEFETPFNLDLGPPRATPDLRYIAFASSSRELLPEDAGSTGLTRQIYVLDRQSNQLHRMSRSAMGDPGDAPSSSAEISDDGRYVAFFSRATNLPAGGSAIYVIDRTTDRWVNVTSTLGPLVGVSTAPNLELARDGSAIVFSWRSADPASPFFDRLLVFTAELRGGPPATPAIPVPLGQRELPALLVTLLLVLGGWRLASRPGWARR